jgi:hypothetical protein
MDRVLNYAGQVPLETDILSTNRNVMKALGWLAQGVFGTPTLVTDLTVVPATPAALSVVVNPGAIYNLGAVDSGSYSSLASDTSHSIIRQGIMADATTLAITPPGSQSQIYLIQAGFSEVDSGSITLPYYNPSQPAIAWSGPTGSGTPQFTMRQHKLVVSAKPGSVSGSPVAPAPDAGFVGLYAVTVAAGALTITGGNIARLTTAPMLATNGQLPLIPVGVQNATWSYADDTGTANNIIIAPQPPPSSYTKGQLFFFKANATNTGAVTANVIGPSGTSLGSKSVLRPTGTAMSANDKTVGGMCAIQYDGTNFQFVSWNGAASGGGGSTPLDLPHWTVQLPSSQGLSVGVYNVAAFGGSFTEKTSTLPNTSIASGVVTVGSGEGGWYFINFNTITDAAPGPCEAGIYVNNNFVGVQAENIDIGWGVNASVAVQMRLNPGDTIKGVVYPTYSGLSLLRYGALAGTYNVTTLSATRLSS